VRDSEGEGKRESVCTGEAREVGLFLPLPLSSAHRHVCNEDILCLADVACVVALPRSPRPGAGNLKRGGGRE
jgi:hypothetical protein